jgi:hypothetical protein
MKVGDRVIVVPNIYLNAVGERATIEEVGTNPEDWDYLYLLFDNTKLAVRLVNSTGLTEFASGVN